MDDLQLFQQYLFQPYGASERVIIKEARGIYIFIYEWMDG